MNWAALSLRINRIECSEARRAKGGQRQAQVRMYFGLIGQTFHVSISAIYTLLLSPLQIKDKTNNRTILSLLVSPTIVDEVSLQLERG